MKRYTKVMWLAVLILMGAGMVEVQSDEIRDPSEVQGYRFLETPTYLVNKDHVIFQYNDTRIVFKPDISSFEDYGPRSALAFDKYRVYYAGEAIDVAPEGLKAVAEYGRYGNIIEYWKTDRQAFFGSKEIKGVDAPSLTHIEYYNNPYIKDKNHVYYKTNMIKGADPASISSNMSGMAYDKYYVYEAHKIKKYKEEKVFSVNRQLCKTSDKVLKYDLESEIDHMDAKTLQGLSRSFSKDKNHVYYDDEILPIPKKNFDKLKIWDQVNAAYIYDGEKLYSRTSEFKFPELDIHSFGMIPRSDYITDKNGVYSREWDSKKKKLFLVKEDPTNLPNVGRDKAEAYQIKGENLYYEEGDKPIEKNVGSVSMVHDFYQMAKTQNHIYIEGAKVKGDIDAQSFTEINAPYFKDKSAIYRLGNDKKFRKIERDFSTFVIHDAYSLTSDKNGLYYANSNSMKDVDVKVEGISSNGLEVLAVFEGYRAGCGFDREPQTNVYLIKDEKGYWEAETGKKLILHFAGKKLPKGISNIVQ